MGQRLRFYAANFVRATRLEGRSRPPESSSASFGVAEAQDLYDRTMLQRADDAMYQAKQSGRNRVEVAGPTMPQQELAA